jgi:hypothetical protein
VPLAADVELEKIARGTPGFSGADLENLVNEAALWAARWNKKEVELVDFEMAKDKVLMGAERKSMVLSDEEKRTTAYHEAGHALMAKLLAWDGSRSQGHDHSPWAGAGCHDAACRPTIGTITRRTFCTTTSQSSWAGAWLKNWCCNRCHDWGRE